MIRDFIKALGGPTDVADALKSKGFEKITDRAVVAWSVRDTIPWKWREPVALLAVEKDIKPKDIPEDVRRFTALEALG